MVILLNYNFTKGHYCIIVYLSNEKEIEMLKWGNEETQKEGEFFEDNQMKEYSLVCCTGDFKLQLGYALAFASIKGEDGPVFLETARGGFRTFKTVDAAINLCKAKDVGSINVFFDPR